jgi:hypothetical protein
MPKTRAERSQEHKLAVAAFWQGQREARVASAPESRRGRLKQHKRARRGKPRNWCCVYVLREAPAAPVRYVRQTRCLLSERLKLHLKSPLRRKQAGRRLTPVEVWIAGLMLKGCEPVIEMLAPDAVWDVTEIVLMDRLRREGHPLLNVVGVVPQG